MARLLLATALLLLVATLCSAQVEGKWREYPQFRHVSTLPGNAFGVTPEGKVGFDGALQQNIPVAYTPAKGQYWVGYWSGSNNSSIAIGFEGGDVNGTGGIGVGFGKPGNGLYASYMVEDETLRNCANVQYQLLPETSDHPAVAIGVLDLLDMRQAFAGVGHGARSFYATATRRAGSDEKPVYFTVGFGSGRFGDRPFGGVSWSFHENLTAALEYDGLNTNAGIAYGIGGRDPERRWTGVAFLGYAGLEKPVIGICAAYRR